MTSPLFPTFALGEIVYLLTDPEQSQRMITEIGFTLDGGEVYVVAGGTHTSKHYAREMSREPRPEFLSHEAEIPA